MRAPPQETQVVGSAAQRALSQAHPGHPRHGKRDTRGLQAPQPRGSATSAGKAGPGPRLREVRAAAPAAVAPCPRPPLLAWVHSGLPLYTSSRQAL